MRDATECINSIGYALFSVIKVSKGAKIRNQYNQLTRYSATHAYEVYLSMSRYMRFLTMWYVRRAEPQVSLRKRAV